MLRITGLTILLALATFLNSASAQNVQLQPLATFGTNNDGSIRPWERTYLTTNSFERGMAFNPKTGHLLLVHRDTFANTFTVHKLDSTTGEDLGTMDVQDVTAGNPDFKVNLIGVADDGAIYACNLSSSTTPPELVLYRAGDESQRLSYVNYYDPSGGTYAANSNNKRWGDSLAVRGSGAGTQILLTSQSGTAAAILTPTDASMADFTLTPLTTDVQNGAIGYGVTFGAGDTFWAKGASTAGNPLLRLSFNLTTRTATTLQTYSTTNFPGRVGPLMLNTASNLLAAIESIPGIDRVRLYDVATLANPPVLLDRQSYPTNADENNVFAGALAFGTNGSGAPTLYALDCNSGILAFALVQSNHTVAPTVFQQPVTQFVSPGSNVTFAVGADGVPAPTYYQWYFNVTNVITDGTSSSLTISDLQPANSGRYSVVVTNSSGSATSSLARLTVVATTGGLLSYEPFDYAPDQLLTAANSAWTLNGSGNDTRVTSGSLSIPGLLASVGNSITNGGSGAAVRSPLPSPVINGELYYSFAFRLDSLGTVFTNTASFVAAFYSSSDNAYYARFMARTNAPGQYDLGLTKVSPSGTTPVWAPDAFLENEIVFVVARYTFNASTTTDDQVDLWINPDPASFSAVSPPPATLSAQLTGTDASVIDQFTFRQNTAANTPAALSFDELRLGRTWASVTPKAIIPPPVMAIVRTGNNAVLSWPTNDSADYVLEGIAGFNDADGWLPVNESPVVQGTNNIVTVNAASGSKLFRLKK